MTSNQPYVSPLRQRMTDDMRMRQLSPKTQAGYLRIVREFARYLKRSPDTATIEDLRNYQLYLVDRGTSPVSLNAAITGLKFFFEITLYKPELMARRQPVRVPRVLPVILSPTSPQLGLFPTCGDDRFALLPALERLRAVYLSSARKSGQKLARACRFSQAHKYSTGEHSRAAVPSVWPHACCRDIRAPRGFCPVLRRPTQSAACD